MGKIVKFCSACEEGFAEKFSFCPNCASELSAFEMKPVVEETAPAEPAGEPRMKEHFEEKASVSAPADISSVEAEEAGPAEEVAAEVPETNGSRDLEDLAEPTIAAAGGFDPAADIDSDNILELDVEGPAEAAAEPVELDVADTAEPDEYDEPAADAASVTPAYFAAEEPAEEEFYGEDGLSETDTFEAAPPAPPAYDTDTAAAGGDDGYHVTVVSERGGPIRNGLLLGAFTLITFGFIGLMVYSLFANLQDVGSLTEDERLLALLNEEPMQSEEVEKKKDDDEGGGGGGGGKENPKPVSQGELPSQTRMLTPPPQVVPRLDDPALKVINMTQGDIKRDRTSQVGLPDGLQGENSSGPGSGGGIGTGKGTGVGSGFGTGEGSGTGSGSGSGVGDGTGDGTGDGRGTGRSVGAPPPPPKTGPTTGIKILSKPKPGYTDAARQNNVTGVVRVRVAFLANGSIGGVSVVSGLPHGLTEKAIAAARQIRFEPPMRNGVPYSVNKVVVFNFNIY